MRMSLSRLSVVRNPRRVGAGVVAVLALVVAGVAVPAAASTARPGTVGSAGTTFVDISTRAASLAFWNANYTAAPASGWNGNISTCTPGTTSLAYQNAIAKRINFFRAMAGVPSAVAVDPSLNAQEQAAALIMAAQGDLSHNPPNTWKCWTQTGADAANQSNLSLGASGVGAIDSYMDDSQPGMNDPVGHRRYILYPQTQTYGSGDIPTGGTNALAVFDSHYNDPRPGTRDGYVAWPPAGYVPNTVIYKNWSLSDPGVDFTNATVTMTKNGAAYPVTLQTPETGFGENTLVWQVPDIGDDSSMPQPATDIPFTVSITGASLNGVAKSYHYTVTAFSPTGTVPAPPTNVSATPGNGQATVSWTAPASDGGSPITGYKILSSPGGILVNAGANATSATVTGLVNGNAYTFTMVATNVNGNSSVSAASSPVTPTAPLPGAPGAPGNVTVKAGNASVAISWTTPTSNGGSAISGYTIQASPGGSMWSYPATTHSSNLGALTNGVTYTFTVYAQNAAGYGPGTTSAAVTPSAPSKATTVQEAQLTYDSWQPQTLSGASGGTVRMTDTANSTASFVFTATAVTWLTRGGPTMGQAQVLIDGVNKGTVDLYRPTAQAVTQAYKGLKKVKHTLTIKALGTHNASATDSVVAVDGFKVGTKVTQDSTVKVTYGSWSGLSNTSANGKTLRLASAAGATARYTFTGTGIDWITALGPAYGQAQVSIDGASVGTYNLYAANQQWKVTKAFSGLTAGSHQLVITVLGTKGTAAAKGTGVVVDAVVVHS